MNKVEQALKSAIEALEANPVNDKYGALKLPALAQCKAALAEIEKCEPVAEVTAQWVIDFIGSNYNSMRTHDEQCNELPIEQITYSLTVHDLLSAFAYTSIKPVAYRYKEDGYWVYTELHKDKFNSQALYTSPQSKEWVGLSVEDISLMAFNDDEGDWNDLRFRDCWKEGYLKGAKAIEAKLKELNT